MKPRTSPPRSATRSIVPGRPSSDWNIARVHGVFELAVSMASTCGQVAVAHLADLDARLRRRRPSRGSRRRLGGREGAQAVDLGVGQTRVDGPRRQARPVARRAARGRPRSSRLPGAPAAQRPHAVLGEGVARRGRPPRRPPRRARRWPRDAPRDRRRGSRPGRSPPSGRPPPRGRPRRTARAAARPAPGRPARPRDARGRCRARGPRATRPRSPAPTSACPRPSAVARPMRSPVNPPGPTPTTISSRSETPQPGGGEQPVAGLQHAPPGAGLGGEAQFRDGALIPNESQARTRRGGVEREGQQAGGRGRRRDPLPGPSTVPAVDRRPRGAVPPPDGVPGARRGSRRATRRRRSRRRRWPPAAARPPRRPVPPSR